MASACQRRKQFKDSFSYGATLKSAVDGKASAVQEDKQFKLPLIERKLSANGSHGSEMKVLVGDTGRLGSLQFFLLVYLF